MFTNKDSIKIKIAGMNNYLSMGQYLTEVNYEYPKLWGESGRTLSGDMVATYIGIFPKLVLSFRRLTKTELELIAPILDSAEQTIQYYDPVKKATITMETYTGDWSVRNKGIIKTGRTNEGFEVSFIARKKRV